MARAIGDDDFVFLNEENEEDIPDIPKILTANARKGRQ